MAKKAYQADGNVFVEGALYEDGEIFYSDRKPGKHWIPVKTKESEAKQQAEGGDPELEALRQEYEEVVGSKPHHKAKAETLREKIDEAKQQAEA